MCEKTWLTVRSIITGRCERQCHVCANVADVPPGLSTALRNRPEMTPEATELIVSATRLPRYTKAYRQKQPREYRRVLRKPEVRSTKYPLALPGG